MKRTLPYLICLLLLGSTLGALSIKREFRGNPDAPVNLELPDRIGSYEARDVVFCQGETCARMFEKEEIGDATQCPACGGALDPISLGEKRLLPDDTPIFRRAYHAGQSRSMMVTVVFSGVERRSIHKPQVCLKAQGNTIRKETTIHVDLPGRDALGVRLLDIASAVPLSDGRTGQQLGLYAYWFFNPEFETCIHNVRLARMAADNVLRAYRPRWAYVIVSTTRRYTDEERDIQAIKDFVPLLMPVFNEVRAAMLSAEASGAIRN